MALQFPDDFRCPISLEIMTDPVIIPSGHTFDRSSIQRWLDSGNLTCPLTNAPLPPSPPLIPNHALRSLIANSNSTPDNPQNPQTVPDPKTLALTLRFPADPQSLAAVLRLSKRSSAFCRILSDSGAVSVLLRHLAPDSPADLREVSLRCILYLSLDGDDVCVGLVAEGAVEPVVAALRGDDSVRALAATTLTSLAVVEVNKCTIGAHPGAIVNLVSLVSHGNTRERREAATALYELCKFPENRRRAVRAGAVPPLVGLVAGGSERAIEVLGLLGKCREGREEMRRIGGFVRILVEVLRVGSGRAIEHALLVLNLVCGDCREMAVEALGEGVLEMCVAFFDETNEKIAKNSAVLARTLEKVGFRRIR